MQYDNSSELLISKTRFDEDYIEKQRVEQLEAFPTLTRIQITYSITTEELQIFNKCANRETMLFLLLQIHQLDHNLPKVWDETEIKQFCDLYSDEQGNPFIKCELFTDLIRKLEKKGILETDRQLTFTWL